MTRSLTLHVYCSFHSNIIRIPSPNVKAALIENGQKFIALIGSHYRRYNGTVFYIDKAQPVELDVNGRVMIDAAFL